MLKRRIGSVFVVIGAVLLAAALLLFLYNQNEDERAGEAAGAALEAMQQVIEEGNGIPPMLDLTEEETEPEETTEAAAEATEPTELTAVNIDGYNYIGYLSIPAFELELPIMDDWSEERLRIAPCLQYGSPLTDDAVIAGHNYKHHFLPLHSIEIGEQVTFTDMTGYTIEYSVVEWKIIDPRNVSEVVDSEYDLILYTCTSGGQERVIVCCDRADKADTLE